MSAPQFVNSPGGQILSTLSANAQSQTDTVVTPGALAGFPTSPWFTVLVRETAELLQVTGINAGPPVTWTVVRGFGGSAAQAIGVNNHFDYSLTREMLLAGMHVKLDEAVITATTPTITLNVPNLGFTFRQLHITGRIHRAVTGGANIAARWGGDASANYYNAYLYGGSGTSNGTWNAWTMAYLGWIGGLLGSGGSTMDMVIDGLTEGVWTRFHNRQFYNGSGGETYVMHIAGEHRVATAFNSITFSVSTVSNTWANDNFGNGTVLSLYGVG